MTQCISDLTKAPFSLWPDFFTVQRTTFASMWCMKNKQIHMIVPWRLCHCICNVTGVYRQDPTQLSYNELRKHIAGCVDAKSLTPFPSTVVYRQPQVLYEVSVPVYCKCRSPDDGELKVQCIKCKGLFHYSCIDTHSIDKLWICESCISH